MHYYKFNIADWHLATSHLSLEEEAVYFRLINYYYDTEQVIPKETQTVIRRLRLGSYTALVEVVLNEFFELSTDGWHHKRCDDEIYSYHLKAEKNQKVGKLGGRPKKNNDLDNNPEITQTVSKNNPNVTLTTNHKPITNNHNINVAKAPKSQRFKIEELPKEWEEFCKTERPDLDPKKIFVEFKDYWIAQAGSKGVRADWLATWRNWVRRSFAKAVTTQDKPTIQWHQTMAGVLAKGKELGIEPKTGETEGQYRQRLVAAGA